MLVGGAQQKYERERFFTSGRKVESCACRVARRKYSAFAGLFELHLARSGLWCGVVFLFWRGARKQYPWALGEAGIGQLGGISSAFVEQLCVPAEGTVETSVSGRGTSSRDLCAEFLRQRQLQQLLRKK